MQRHPPAKVLLNLRTSRLCTEVSLVSFPVSRLLGPTQFTKDTMVKCKPLGCFKSLQLLVFRNLFARQHATHKVTVRGGNFMYAKVTHVSVIFVALQGGSARSGS